ncbi:thiol reductant ABC exporter subunit CydC [Galactobacter valiniphilus]|uniref:thiol reductant ABC exporter subunit CydC n=1 Tax=Galactobacter valiniphilus TaxID=2676122 RepID=UPI003734D8E1
MRPEIPEGTTTRGWLLALGALAATKAAGLIALMSALAAALTQAASGHGVDVAALLWWGIPGALARAGAHWGTRVVAQRAALGVKEELRAQLVAKRLASGQSRGAAEASVLASRGLDGLDPYFRDYLPALVASAIIPLAVGARILMADWVSALILVLTIPLVPIFMILIGLHTAERVQEAQNGLDRLSHHLSELARGLPVLVGLRRAEQQRKALYEVSERHRESTMATLRTAFLSSFALELIATLSVAVVAVFIGVRLVGGSLGLEAGLVALMLAPDCFLPLRELGSAHHASEDGVAALRRVRAELDATDRTELAARGAHAVVDGVEVRELVVLRGDGREGVGPVSFEAPAGRITALTGPSGSGKSSVLETLAGLLRPAPEGQADAHDTVSGELLGLDPARRASIAQAPQFAQATARGELEVAGGAEPFLELAELLPERLWDVPLQRLSPGERRRVAVARGLARARVLLASDGACVVLLADEPTAHLDPRSAQRVRALIGRIAARGACVVLATHDPALASQADVRVRFGSQAAVRAAAEPLGEAPLLPSLGTGSDPAALHEGARAVGSGSSESPAPPAPDSGDETPGRHRALPRGAWGLLPLRSWRLWLAVLLGALSVLAAAALSALSGWLIVRASTQPHIMYLLTAIVGVRAFGLARAVLRYRERLATHDVILRYTSKLRVRLWDALGSDARGWSKLTRPGGALGTLVAQVDELRDALPRVLVPVPAAVLAGIGSIIAVALLAPAALPATLVVVLLGLLALPLLVLALERSAAAHAAEHRAAQAERTGRIMAAAPDASANGLAAAELERFAAADAAGSTQLRRDAFGAGAGRAAASLLAGVGAIAVVLTAAGGTAPELLALSVLLLLALDEPLGQLADALRNAPVVTGMLGRLAPWLLGASRAQDSTPVAQRPAVDGLRVDGLEAAYAEAAPAVFSGVSGEAVAGRAWAITGPSGSGKSTLIAAVLGFLAPRAGSVSARTAEGWRDIVLPAGSAEPADPAARDAVAWCPQEGYVFDSTLRGNLALARDRGDAPGDADMIHALDRVGLGPWFARLPEGLETRTGAGGEALSGGQRQRLAVARTLLSGAGVVVLDEPTAHLGADESGELVGDVLGGAGATALVLVTHDEALASLAAAHTTLSSDGTPATTRLAQLG